jgi:iron complex outermembrane receptor protein
MKTARTPPRLCGLLVAAIGGAATAGTDPDAAAEPTPLRRVEVTSDAGASDDPLPVSQARLDADALAAAGVDALAELPARVPNLRIGSLGGRAGQHHVGLRGFLNHWGAGEAPLLLRLDGVSISDPLSFDQRLADVARVEVSAGPQGTRYAANAAAGVIDIVTRKPDEQARAWTSLGVASRGGYAVNASLSGPLAGDWSGDMVLLADGGDGAIDNLVGPERPYDRQRDRSLRARLLWRPDHQRELQLQLWKRDSADRGGEQYLPLDPGAFNALPTLGGLQLGDFDQAIDEPGFNRIDATTAALSWRWSADTSTWSAQATSRRSDQASLTDYDLSPQPWFTMDSRWRIDEDRLELQVESAPDGAWRWLGGLTAQRRELDTDRLFNAGPSNPWQFTPGAYVRSDALLSERELAGFGEISRALDREARWRLGVGTRLQWSDRRIDFGTNGIGAPAMRLRRQEHQLQGKLSLERRFGEQVHAFASLATGGRPAGFNPGTFQALQAQFDRERLLAAEVGAQGRLARDIDWRAALFDQRVDDYQELTFAAAEFTTYVRNVERVRMRGAELQAGWEIDDRWRVGTTLGRVNARYQRDLLDAATGFALDGRRLPLVPRYNALFELEYRADPWFARAEWVGAGGFDAHAYDAPSQQFATERASAQRIANLALGWRGQHWSLTARADNAGDQRYFTHANFAFQAVAFYPGAVGSIGPRRTFSLTLRYDN